LGLRLCDWATGDKKRQRLGYTKKEADREYIRLIERMESKTHIPKSALTFADALDAYEKWCEQRLEVKDRMEAGTLARLRHSMNVHLRPDLGHVYLKDMDTPTVEAYLFEKAKKYRTMHFECYQVIKSALDRAVKIDMLPISPLSVKKIWLPPRPKSTRKIPTIGEGRALWHALVREENPRLRAHSFETRICGISLAMFGGMCAGEISGLQWENVDFIHCVLFVGHSLSIHGGLKGPKTKDRERYIPLSQEMNEWLTRGCSATGAPRDRACLCGR
jgi:integrase